MPPPLSGRSYTDHQTTGLAIISRGGRRRLSCSLLGHHGWLPAWPRARLRSRGTGFGFRSHLREKEVRTNGKSSSVHPGFSGLSRSARGTLGHDLHERRPQLQKLWLGRRSKVGSSLSRCRGKEKNHQKSVRKGRHNFGRRGDPGRRRFDVVRSGRWRQTGASVGRAASAVLGPHAAPESPTQPQDGHG